MSVQACLRGGTRVDVALNLDPASSPDFDPADALAITPGGGRLGTLLAGAFDGQLVDRAGVHHSRGRVVELDIGPLEASASGLEQGSTLRCLLAPATELPDDLWPLLLEREPVSLVGRLDGDEVTEMALYTADTIARAGEDAAAMFARGVSNVVVQPDVVTVVLWPRPTVVILGGGDMGDALLGATTFLGWSALVTGSAGDAAGLAATLSPIDGVVVTGHDAEMTGRVLEAALQGNVGYIGSIGPRSVREARAEWLEYRGVTDQRRIRGPAGLDIGARNPREVALAVVAEMIAAQTAEH